MIEHIPITDIHPNKDNPRTIDKGKLKKLQQSIKDFPEMLRLRPVVVDKDNIILGGNMRYQAAKNNGEQYIYVIKAENLTEEQKKEFIVKDNVSFGEWDYDMLANEYDLDILTEWAVDIPDYLGEDEEEQEELEEDGFSETAEEVEVTVEVGDLIVFTKGDQLHKLYVGDSTLQESWVRLMELQKGQLIYTDPPYGVSYTGQGHDKAKVWDMIENDELRLDELVQLIQDSFGHGFDFTDKESPFYCFLANINRMQFEQGLNESGWEIKQELIWNKGMTLGRSDYHWTHEPCLYGKKKNQTRYWYGDRTQKTILTHNFDPNTLSKKQLVKILQELQRGSTNWEIKKDSHNTYIHPTQKPLDLAGRAIQNSTKEGDIVIDMFSGSGSTLLATHKLNRNFRGMELDPKYAQLIMNRVSIYDTDIEIKVIKK